MNWLALTAGIFIGTTLALALVVLVLARLLKTTDTERKLWINKALVREGQSRLFPDAMIDANALPDKPATRPMQVKSPFQAARERLNETLQSTKRPHIPSNIQAVIQNAADRAKESEAS